MKQNAHDKRTILLFIECTAVFIFFVFPPLFSHAPFILPPRPAHLYEKTIFIFKLFGRAAYEELLYRLYLPDRLHTIYEYYKKRLLSFSGMAEINHHAAFFTEILPVVLFASAHYYLGFFSMLFAAAAGALFRFIYLRLQKFLSPIISAVIVMIMHGSWNGAVYLYLWQK